MTLRIRIPCQRVDAGNASSPNSPSLIWILRNARPSCRDCYPAAWQSRADGQGRLLAGASLILVKYADERQ